MFDVLKLKGKLGKIRDWMKNHHFPPRLLFLLMGIISTLWFLIRVIPKPSRATYPCMRIAAPFMSGFVVYLVSLGGITLALRKVKQNILRAKYIASAAFLVVALAGMIISLTHSNQNVYGGPQAIAGPDDGPNQPMGQERGIKPGRVIWAWNPKATNENCTNDYTIGDFYFNPVNYDQETISKMFSESVKKLTGKKTISKSWDAMFLYFNNKKNHINKGYSAGEKIFIKINQTSGRGRLDKETRSEGKYYYPAYDPAQKRIPSVCCETDPPIVLEILRQLINECGIEQSDIAVGDTQNPTWGHNFDAWAAEFPNVVYTDNLFGTHGRTLVKATANDLVFYSDKSQTDKLYDIIENADYMINVANLKPHSIAGITLTAKNHFGSQSRSRADHLHYSHPAKIRGYKKYRVLVDLMGSKYLGQNTILYVVDGLWGGGSFEVGPPVKYFMAPFNNDWCNSIFISQDQVALESVCFDVLRTEWNGINKHDPSNNAYEDRPNINGVDDYLHQAADPSNWPSGIIYDPDNSGKPISSLGTHEHWNNPIKKQYSRNLGYNIGIELVSIPDTLVKTEVFSNKNVPGKRTSK